MSDDYMRGLAFGVGAILVLVGLPCLALAVIRWWPNHWSLRGPQRRPGDPRRVFRSVNLSGRHLASFRRVFAVGPWAVYLGRYRPGRVEDIEVEDRIP